MKIDQPPSSKLRAAFNQRIARNALEHQEQYSLRTGTILDARGFLDGLHQEMDEPELLAIIVHADHPARVAVSPGPLLFYRLPADAMTLTCVEMPELILHPDQTIRSSAIRFFQLIDGSVLTRATIRALEHFAADASSVNTPIWQAAAVNLFDSLKEDYLLALAGLRQSLSVNHSEMARQFVFRALDPSLVCVDRLGSEITVAVAQPAAVTRRIEEIGQTARSLTEVCTAYFYAFGHLPLTKSLSIVRAVEAWQQGQITKAMPASLSWWQEVWSWAENAGSPLARYQAACLFVQRPDLIPDGCMPELWQEIRAFLEPLEGEATTTVINPPTWSVALRFRQATAVHYYNYLAARAASLSEDVIGEWAWWMAERFCACFGMNPQVQNRILEGAVRPVSERSAYEAALTLPRPKRSNLCHATIFEGHLWSLALLNGLGGEFMAASLPTFSAEQGNQFVQQLCRHLLVALPLAVDGKAPLTYAVDKSLTSTMQEWRVAIEQTPFATALETLLAGEEERFTPDTLLVRLKGFLSLTCEEQLSTMLSLSLLLSAGRAPNKALLDVVAEPGWLGDTMYRLDPRPCEALLGVLCAAPYPEHETWLRWLYQLAAVCEQPSLSVERRTLIFEFIVAACTVTDSIGPVSKLLNGAHKSLFLQDAARCQAKMESAYPVCSQAVKAVIRSIINLLHTR